MSIPDDVIEQVRDAADIAALVGEHVELRRTGSDYRGPCPFHGGTHRNFAVIPKKQMFYCFVCHEGGDVFTFYMKRFGMDYPTAVREVAAKCGVAIPERPAAGPDPREPLFTAVAVAAEWYARRLRAADDAGRAREYLTERAFALDRLLPHGLGFAPKGEEFLEAMAALGIGVEVLLGAGLAARREDGAVRPRFWNRLLFPIHDLRGRPVGFGGRLLGEGEPKYLNSPDSPIFHKGKLLYQLHEAKHAIRKAERAVVVEGYFDVLRLVDTGLGEVVAPLGTALTPDQAGLLKRYTQTVILLYDSDVGGVRASFRSADELLRAGLRVLVATPPPAEDPDTLARRGGIEAITELLDDALDVLERKLQLLERKGWLGTVAGRRRALDRLLPTLRAAADPVTRDLYVGRTAEALGVSAAAVGRETDAGRRWVRPEVRSGTGAGAETPTRRRRGGPEWELLRVMVWEPAWRGRIGEHLERLEPGTGPAHELLRLLATTDPSVPAGELLERVDGEARAMLSDLLSQPWGPPHVDPLVEGAVSRLESRALRVRVRAIDRQMTLATENEKVTLMREKQSLVQQIRARDAASGWRGVRR